MRVKRNSVGAVLVVAVVWVAAACSESDTTTFSMRPVLGVFSVSPALSDPTGTHPPGVDPATGLTVVDDITTEAYLLEPATGDVFWVGAAFVTNEDIASAEAVFMESGPGAWVVRPGFTDSGGEKFQSATAGLAQEPIGSATRQIAIVVDGEIISAPALAADVGLEGLNPDNILITVGAAEKAEQRATDLAKALQR